MQARSLWLAAFALAAILAVSLLLSEPARDAAATFAARGGLAAIVLIGLFAVAVWSVRQLPPKRRSRRPPPGVSWSPSGTWWGHRRRDE